MTAQIYYMPCSNSSAEILNDLPESKRSIAERIEQAQGDLIDMALLADSFFNGGSHTVDFYSKKGEPLKAVWNIDDVCLSLFEVNEFDKLITSVRNGDAKPMKDAITRAANRAAFDALSLDVEWNSVEDLQAWSTRTVI